MPKLKTWKHKKERPVSANKTGRFCKHCGKWDTDPRGKPVVYCTLTDEQYKAGMLKMCCDYGVFEE